MSSSINERKIRVQKLKHLMEQGIDPYPARHKRTHTCEEALIKFNKLKRNNTLITIAGRIKAIRLHGGASFAHIEDESAKLQIYLKRDILGDRVYRFFRELVDVADFVRVKGVLFKTRKGEKTLEVQSLKMLAKSLLPLPEKWHGLSDIEVRTRKRYLDLIVNPAVKLIFRKRALIIKLIREFLNELGFIEVETPILQTIPGGALATPFVTHHKVLDIDLYLRVAPELYLKRLLVGGLEKVYEIGKCFRNEGIDHAHNPEFTQIEFYLAYRDYNEIMRLTEKLLSFLVRKIEKRHFIEYAGTKIDFTPPYPRVSFREALKKYAKIDIDELVGLESLARKAKTLGLKIEPSWGRGKILDELYKEYVREKLIQPTFIIDHPVEFSPLAKRKRGSPGYVERCQLIVAGLELTNGFSELNDPLDQRERFEEQERLRAKGDDEASRIDEDYLKAMEHGMPPCAGNGLGIDRLVAILTDSHSLKEVILFPTLKPKE